MERNEVIEVAEPDENKASLLTNNEPEQNEIKFKKLDRNKLGIYLKTATLIIAFFVFGFDMIVLGLALPTLAENMGKTIAEISPCLMGRGIGFLTGSMSTGFMEGRLDVQIMLCVGMILMSVGMFFTPIVLNIYSLVFFSFLSSFGLGAFETVGNVFCLKLWGKRSNSVLQTLHFFYCFGCVLCPIATKPFLNEPLPINHSVPVNESAPLVFRNVTYLQETSIPYLSGIYIIVSISGLVVAACFVVLKCLFTTEYPARAEEAMKKENKTFRYTILAILFVLFFFYVGVFLTFITFLYAFAISSIPGARYSRTEASNLNTLFLSSMTVGQFIAIFLALKLTPKVNLMISMLVSTVSVVGFLLLPFYQEERYVFWILVGIFGFFSASIYGNCYLWANTHIVIDERASSVFIVGASCGEMLLPLVVGLLIDENPMRFLYVLCGYFVALLIVFTTGIVVADKLGKRFKGPTIASKEREMENMKLSSLEAKSD